MKRVVLHIGGDKCGSSSIQAFLSNSTLIHDESIGTCFEYACLQPRGLIRGKAVRRKAKGRPSGYLNSINLKTLASLPRDTLDSIRSSIATCPNSLVFSNEGWLRCSQERLTWLTDLITSGTDGPKLEAVAFVRPPVSWINSAWWQWGAWQESLSFDDWVDQAIESTHWAKFLMRVKQHPAISKLSVEPMLGDVVDQLCSSLMIRSTYSKKFRSNTSLPAVALRLYQEHRNLRPGSHDCKNDYIILRAIAKSTHDYGGTPWVLSVQQVERILEATRASSYELLELVNPDTRQYILGDARWWEAKAFPSSPVMDTSKLPVLDAESCFSLATDLLIYLETLLRKPLSRYLNSDLHARASSLGRTFYQSSATFQDDPILCLSTASDLLDCINEAVKISRRYGLHEMLLSDSHSGLSFVLSGVRPLASRKFKQV